MHRFQVLVAVIYSLDFITQGKLFLQTYTKDLLNVNSNIECQWQSITKKLGVIEVNAHIIVMRQSSCKGRAAY